MDLRLFVCQIIIYWALFIPPNGAQPTSSASSVNLAPYEARRPTHCIATPQNLSFCSSKLGWMPTMALPNLSGQENEGEVVSMLRDSPIAELANVNCKANQNLKLLMCSVMAPVCLDVMVQPCRHLCVLVKKSCEPALRRQGLEWPRFLDCRRFPSSGDGCLRRQPMLGTNLTATMNLTDTMTTLEATQEQIPANVYNTSQRKRKVNRGKINRKVSSTTTSTTTPAPSSSTSSSSPIEDTEENNLVTSVPETQTTDSDLSITTTTTTVASTTAMTTPPPSTSTTSNPTSTTLTTTCKPETSPIPISISEDLIQALCSTSPEWLIKTKLSDAQLLSAGSKRRLKIRSFRLIFGSLPNQDGNLGSSNARLVRNRTGNSTTSPGSLYIAITNSTLFAAAMGSSIYTQPISDALPKNGQIKPPPGSNPVRYYLIAGSGSSVSSGKISASVLVVWPSNRQSTSAADSQGNQNIITAYRDLKRRGAKACNRQDNAGNTDLSNGKTEDGPDLPANMTVTESTLTNSSSQVLSEPAQTPRSRESRKKQALSPS